MTSQSLYASFETKMTSGTGCRASLIQKITWLFPDLSRAMICISLESGQNSGIPNRLKTIKTQDMWSEVQYFEKISLLFPDFHCFLKIPWLFWSILKFPDISKF